MGSEPPRFGPAGTTLRKAVSTDAATIAEMIRDLAIATEGTDKQFSTAQDMAHHGFGGVRRFEAVLAEQDRSPVGLLLYFFNFSSWRGKLGIYVQDIHVVARLRGCGLGRALLLEAVRIGSKEGCTHLRLSVDANNHRARAFYDHMGLKACDDEVIYLASEDSFQALLEESLDGK